MKSYIDTNDIEQLALKMAKEFLEDGGAAVERLDVLHLEARSLDDWRAALLTVVRQGRFVRQYLFVLKEWGGCTDYILSFEDEELGSSVTQQSKGGQSDEAD